MKFIYIDNIAVTTKVYNKYPKIVYFTVVASVGNNFDQITKDKLYHRVIITKIFLRVEFNFMIFISAGSLGKKLKLSLH